MKQAGIGDVEISTIPLPNDVIFRSNALSSATYTYSGKVLVAYHTANDIYIEDYVNLAVLNDDGTSFTNIFSGTIPKHPKSNGGYRFMPFKDNQRILLGDYVLECTPDIDHCTSTELVPVVYPNMIESDPKTMCHWSEVIIAPDNEHMAWTALRTDYSAAALVGKLVRHTDSYIIENVQIISNINSFKEDPDKTGYLIPNTIRGGEVKQFVNGGKAISVIGGIKYCTTDSVVQDLISPDLTQITFTPGYDETTIFSPDEGLGITMSTRFSLNTDPKIFGFMPKPHPLNIGTCPSIYLYTYAVTGVRNVRSGNIGPALININLSKTQSGYEGINLNTDPDWVYYSPMSWHPDGVRAMWMEGIRGGTEMRIQIVRLLDYMPGTPVPGDTTPDNIPYGIRDLTVLSSITKNVQGKIEGAASGYINYTSSAANSYSGIIEAQYINYSDDGVQFYNGFEKLNYNFIGETRYEALILLFGQKSGTMNFRVTFGPLKGSPQAELLFDKDPEDGDPKSFGYAAYDGIVLHVSDLIP